MADGLVPRIIVLALGAGVLGFPDVLRLLVDIAGRSPLTDVAICVFAMAVVTAQALGAMLLARFVRKARAGGDAHAAGAPRADRFAQVTLVVSLGVAFLVSACLLAASGAAAGSLALLQAVADVAREMKSPVVAVLATAAASLLLLLAVSSGGLYIRRGSLVGLSVGVAAVVGTGFTFSRRARNAADGGGRLATAPAADTRRVRKLALLAPCLAVVAFAVLCCLVLATYAPLESGPDGAKDPCHDHALLD